MIQFKCACCGQLLQLADEWAGKVAKCPFSGQYMQVPLPSPVAAPVPKPAPKPPAVPVPAPPAPVQIQAQPKAKAPAPAAPRGASSWNPFAAASAPPAAEFGTFSTAVSGQVQNQMRGKSLRAAWRTRGALLGAAGGLMLGGMFGLLLGAFGRGGSVLLTGLTVALGGATLGAGVGGIIGPLVLIVRPGVKKILAPGAVTGALYGTARVAGFGAIGGLLTGMLNGAFELLRTGDVATAALSAILTALLLALGWAAAGAFIGVFFGAALGAVGGYES